MPVYARAGIWNQEICPRAQGLHHCTKFHVQRHRGRKEHRAPGSWQSPDATEERGSPPWLSALRSPSVDVWGTLLYVFFSSLLLTFLQENFLLKNLNWSPLTCHKGSTGAPARSGEIRVGRDLDEAGQALAGAWGGCCPAVPLGPVPCSSC